MYALWSVQYKKNITLTTVHISRYSIPKSPENYQIPLMQPFAVCSLFIQNIIDCGIVLLLK